MLPRLSAQCRPFDKRCAGTGCGRLLRIVTAAQAFSPLVSRCCRDKAACGVDLTNATPIGAGGAQLHVGRIRRHQRLHFAHAMVWSALRATEDRVSIGINICKHEIFGGDAMSITLLEHLRDELISSGAVQNTPEFCRCWLGRSEGYIRTLRYHQIEPSVETLAVCSNKLGYYADRLRGSDSDEHQAWIDRFDRLKSLCDQAIERQAQSVWRAPHRMSV